MISLRPSGDADAHSIRTGNGFSIVAVDTGPCQAPGCTCRATDQPWSYTVGRSTQGKAELVITGGYDLSFIADVTIHVAHHIDAHGLLDELDEKGVWELGATPLRLDRVPQEWLLYDPNRMARWVAKYVRRGEPFTPPDVLQIVWPDHHGRFPDDPQCHPVLARSQALLALDPIGYPAIEFGTDLAG